MSVKMTVRRDIFTRFGIYPQNVNIYSRNNVLKEEQYYVSGNIICDEKWNTSKKLAIKVTLIDKSGVIFGVRHTEPSQIISGVDAFDIFLEAANIEIPESIEIFPVISD